MSSETVVTATVEANEAIERYNALVAARAECASGLRKANGLIVTYASAISTVCGEGWVYLVGKESAIVREERKMFDRAMGMVEGTENKALKAKCNEYWRRIKIAAGYVTAGSDGTETIDVKTLKELKTMLNRIVDVVCEEESCPKASLAKTFLMDAYTKMGGDTKTLGTQA